MESIIQTGLKRTEYLEGTIPDIRTIFINFGKFLLSKGIESEGTLEDYEDFLNEWDKQKELERQDKHLELLKWIDENEYVDFPFRIVRGNEWDRFYNSDDEDDIMDMISVECNEFYTKFKEITGVDLMIIDDFINMSYIDEAQNDIELTVNINGNNESFIIGV